MVGGKAPMPKRHLRSPEKVEREIKKKIRAKLNDSHSHGVGLELAEMLREIKDPSERRITLSFMVEQYARGTNWERDIIIEGINNCSLLWFPARAKLALFGKLLRIETLRKKDPHTIATLQSKIFDLKVWQIRKSEKRGPEWQIKALEAMKNELPPDNKTRRYLLNAQIEELRKKPRGW